MTEQEMTEQESRDRLRSAMQQAQERKQRRTALLQGADRSDEAACRAVLLGHRRVDEVVGEISTSEQITVALAFGRLDLLPEGYENFRHAWQRLDDRQKDIVDLVATADWQEAEPRASA